MKTLQGGMGPFGMMDRMGLGAVYHVAKLVGETTPNTRALEYARYVDEHLIPKTPPWGHERPGLLHLPESARRPAGVQLTSSEGQDTKRLRPWVASSKLLLEM
jgi:hypothetical protein